MKSLLSEAEAIVTDAEAAGLSVALLGGLAVRAWVGRAGRETYDVDFVTGSQDDARRLSEVLRKRGYEVLPDPWWRRAIAERDGERVIVDWTGPDVVDPRTLDGYRVGGTRVLRHLVTRQVPVIELADLVIIKLLAGRDQDIVDVVVLSAASDPEALAADVIDRARPQGKLVALAEQAGQLRFGIHTGSAMETVRCVAGREPSVAELDRFETLVDLLMDAQ